VLKEFSFNRKDIGDLALSGVFLGLNVEKWNGMKALGPVHLNF
jgi:hypothetical protein